MHRFARSAVISVVVAWAGVASAEDAKPADAKPADATAPAASSVRRDPKGVTGLSPLWEAFTKGDTAMLAKDFDTAISAYRDAITKAPQSALPHYRLAEAQKLKGELKEAEETYNTALRFVGSDGTLKAKILFCLADLSERQKAYDQAIERYTTYETFAHSAGKAKVYPASAAERKKRAQEWKQLTADGAEVKTRIAKRLAELEETARKNSLKK